MRTGWGPRGTHRLTGEGDLRSAPVRGRETRAQRELRSIPVRGRETLAQRRRRRVVVMKSALSPSGPLPLKSV